MHPVFYFTLIYFLIGATGTWLSNRRVQPKEAKQRWLKLIVHFFIVNSLAAIIIYQPALLVYITIFILLIGLYELIVLIQHNRQAPRFYVFAFLIYAATATGFLMMTISFTTGMLIFIFLVVFTFDGFSQITGQIAGKRKLFPKVSPGKTVEGLAGGVIITSITAYLIKSWVPVTGMESLFICAGLIPAAVCGDWLASYYKRKHRVKDFSELIPGHGGILDRFDSWIAAGAFIYYMSLVEWPI